MAYRTNRRKFLQTTTALGVGYWGPAACKPRRANPPMRRSGSPRIGYGLKGPSDFERRRQVGNLVAICEIDKNACWQRRGAVPQGQEVHRLPQDARRDGQEHRRGRRSARPTTATPPAAVMAMKMGKHVYCQKPLTHTIWEARLMAKVAREKKVATQMGNQGTALPTLRAGGGASSRAGAIGKVTRGPRLDRTGPILAAGQRPAQDTPPVPGEPRLGPVARPGPDAALRHRAITPSVARLVGLRHRRLGRHGLPYREHALHGPGPARPDLASRPPPPATTRTAIRSGRSSPSSFRPTIGAGAEDVLVRRRQAARRKTCSRASPWTASGCLVVGEKGKLYAPNDYCDTLSTSSARWTEPKVDVHRIAGPFRGVDPGDQGRPGGHVQFPQLRRRTGPTILLGNLAVWAAAKPRRRQEDRVGRQEPQGHQRPRGRADRQAHLSPALLRRTLHRVGREGASTSERDSSGRGRSDCPRPLFFRPLSFILDP